MRIAYLLLVHECPRQFRLLLLQLLKDPKAGVFVHVDRKSRLEEFRFESPRVTTLSRSINVKWGGISMVDATLELLKAARRENYDYYCLLSGRDFPLRSPVEFRQELERIYPKGLLDGASVVERWTERGLDRVKYFFWYRFKDRDMEVLQSRIARKWGKRLGVDRPFFPDMYPCCGSQWWTLSRPIVDFVFAYLKDHPGYYRFYAWSAMPDEQFFHTLLINKMPEQIINRSQTLVQWENGFPHVFSIPDLDVLRRDRDHFFFRKYSEDDRAMFDCLKELADENKYFSVASE